MEEEKETKSLGLLVKTLVEVVMAGQFLDQKEGKEEMGKVGMAKEKMVGEVEVVVVEVEIEMELE